MIKEVLDGGQIILDEDIKQYVQSFLPSPTQKIF
jgi:hypothetical protein